MLIKTFSYLFYIASVITLSACSEGMSPEAEQAIVPSFDPTQYVGTWYEIARLDNRFEKGLEQVTAKYSIEADGTLKVVNRGFNAKKNDWSEAVGKAKFVDPANADGTRTGRLKVSFFGPFYGEYNILELDKPYYNYALVSSGRDYLWILSRTPQLTYPSNSTSWLKPRRWDLPLTNYYSSDKPTRLSTNPVDMWCPSITNSCLVNPRESGVSR